MTPKFTTPCFIRKNTPELRKKLEELGYKCSATFDDSQKFIWTTETHYYSTNNDMLGCYYGERVLPYGIYCGENEDLFLALAALREDSDKFQWFKCTTPILEGCIRYIRGDLRQCFTNVIPNKPYWRKATPEELIEHFKEK